MALQNHIILLECVLNWQLVHDIKTFMLGGLSRDTHSSVDKAKRAGGSE